MVIVYLGLFYSIFFGLFIFVNGFVSFRICMIIKSCVKKDRIWDRRVCFVLNSFIDIEGKRGKNKMSVNIFL